MSAFLFVVTVSCANGEGVAVEAVVGVDDAAVVYEAGFLLGDELILCSELVAEGLDEVVFSGEFALQRDDGLILGSEGGIEDARHIRDVDGWCDRCHAARFFFFIFLRFEEVLHCHPDGLATEVGWIEDTGEGIEQFADGFFGWLLHAVVQNAGDGSLGDFRDLSELLLVADFAVVYEPVDGSCK